MTTYLKIILLLLTVFAVNSLETRDERETLVFAKFQNFLKEHNKNYNTIEEYSARFNIFKRNFERMELMSLDSKSTTTHTIGITKFFDLTPQEFKLTYLNLQINLYHVLKAQSYSYTISDVQTPAEFDWRKKGAVGPIKDQGQCGSCWAFSAVANLEGIYFIKTGKSIVLSEQELVDCDKVDSGCNGGIMENAFNFVKANGLATSREYPYKGTMQTCKKVSTSIGVKGFHFSGTMDEEQIKQMLVSTGPLSIAINADPLQFYEGGIINSTANDCDPEGLNHGVAIVGYGTENGESYWILRNSWGSSWGENGYFRFGLGKGICGVNKYVVTAELE